jgi:hypothetical protein
MGKSSAPNAPDPYQSANAQYDYGTAAGAYSKALNNVNTEGPTGSTQYVQTGTDPTTGAPVWTQKTTLTPAQQALLSGSEQVQSGAQQTALGEQATAQGALGQVGGELGKGVPNTPGVSYGVGFDPMTGYGQGFSTALQGEEAAMMPGMSQEKEQLDASLRNSGAVPGTPAYDNAMAAEDARQANAQTQAAGSAVGAGTGVANQLQTSAAQDVAQHNAGISQELQDYAQRIGIPLGALQSLMGGSGSGGSGGGGGFGSAGGPSVPGGVAPTSSNVSAPDIMGAFNNQYQGQLAGYNANVASQNADTGAAATIGAGIIGLLSDKRAKEDIEKVGKLDSGLPVYKYKYKGGGDETHLGVIAQEAEKKFPKAVHEIGGLKFVNYAGVA